MSPHERRGWLREVTEAGITVRVFEWRPGDPIYREVRLDGKRDRKSLGHRDRRLALEQGRALARRLAELRAAGVTATLTLGHLWRGYEQHRLPHLSAGRQVHARQHAAFLLAHFGDAFSVEDFSQSHVDGFVGARRDSTLGAKNRKGARRRVRDDTIRQNLNWLAAALAWARGFRVHGRRFLATDPLEGVTLPREKNVRRPVASEARYRATMAKAGEVDPTGRLACLLALARFTGRRLNSLCSLLASDVLLSEQAVTRALAAAGLHPAIARHMAPRSGPRSRGSSGAGSTATGACSPWSGSICRTWTSRRRLAGGTWRRRSGATGRRTRRRRSGRSRTPQTRLSPHPAGRMLAVCRT